MRIGNVYQHHQHPPTSASWAGWQIDSLAGWQVGRLAASNSLPLLDIAIMDAPIFLEQAWSWTTNFIMCKLAGDEQLYPYNQIRYVEERSKQLWINVTCCNLEKSNTWHFASIQKVMFSEATNVDKIVYPSLLAGDITKAHITMRVAIAEVINSLDMQAGVPHNCHLFL